MAHRLFRPLAALLIACLAPGWTGAAELGEPRVSSFIGQQLVADIELGLVEDAANPVGVKLASQDVYRGAGVAMPPVLASLNMTVMRRDGHQFLHLTSLRPVDADHLHVFLELTDGGKRSVRLATLWFAPDPHPAPAPVIAPAPGPVAAPALAPGAALAAPVARTRAAAGAGRAHREAPAAAPKAQPPVKMAAVVPAPRPRPQPPAASPVQRALPLPAPLPIHQAVPPAAACPAQPAAAQAGACLALDGKNAALRAEIGHLESQVRALQVALRATPALAPKARPDAAAAVPKAKPAAAAAVPKAQPASSRKRGPKKPPEEHVPAWTWMAAGGVALALGGAAFAVWRRRAGKEKAKKPRKKAQPEMEIVVTPRVMSDVRSRLMTEGPPSRMPAEPKP